MTSFLVSYGEWLETASSLISGGVGSFVGPAFLARQTKELEMINRDHALEGSEVRTQVMSRRVVHAMFPDPEVAARALGALLDNGVQANDVSAMIKDLPAGARNEKTGTDIIDQASQGITVTTAQDAGSGAVVGAGVGLGLGALAAIATLVIPGVGIVLGAGAIASALGATAATAGAGAIAGAVVGYLKDQGIDATVASLVEEDYSRGGALVSVSTPSGTVSRQDIEVILAKYKDQSYLVASREPSNENRPLEYPDGTIKPAY